MRHNTLSAMCVGMAKQCNYPKGREKSFAWGGVLCTAVCPHAVCKGVVTEFYSVCTESSSDSCYFHEFLQEFFSLSSPLHITNIYTVLIKYKLILRLEWKSAALLMKLFPAEKLRCIPVSLLCILGGINILSWLL